MQTDATTTDRQGRAEGIICVRCGCGMGTLKPPPYREPAYPGAVEEDPFFFCGYSCLSAEIEERKLRDATPDAEAEKKAEQLAGEVEQLAAAMFRASDEILLQEWSAAPEGVDDEHYMSLVKAALIQKISAA